MNVRHTTESVGWLGRPTRFLRQTKVATISIRLLCSKKLFVGETPSLSGLCCGWRGYHGGKGAGKSSSLSVMLCIGYLCIFGSLQLGLFSYRIQTTCARVSLLLTGGSGGAECGDTLFQKGAGEAHRRR